MSEVRTLGTLSGESLSRPLSKEFSAVLVRKDSRDHRILHGVDRQTGRKRQLGRGAVIGTLGYDPHERLAEKLGGETEEKSLEDKIARLSAAVETLQGTVDELQQKVEEKDKLIEEKDEEITRLREELDRAREGGKVLLGGEPDQPALPVEPEPQPETGGWRESFRKHWDSARAPVFVGLGRFATRKVPAPKYEDGVLVRDENGNVVYEERTEASTGVKILGGAAIGLALGYLLWKNGQQPDIDSVQGDINNLEIEFETELDSTESELRAEIADVREDFADSQADQNKEIASLEKENDAQDRTIEALKDTVRELKEESGAEAGAGGMAEGGSGTHTERLEFRGNVIWDDVKGELRTELGHQPSDAQIQKATAHVLKINHLSWEDARHLPVGFSYKIPNNLTAVINR